MLSFPENPELWLELADARLAFLKEERARLNKECEEMYADIVQVRTEMARRAILGGLDEE